MNQKNNNKSRIILGIILLIIIIVCAIYVEFTTNKDNNITSNGTSNLYESLNIDTSKLNIFYLNVGQADATLITMGKEVMLIDSGNKTDGPYITQFLKAQGINKINYLIETHSDSDHSGGMSTIVENFEITKMYMPQNVIASSGLEEIVNIQIFTNLDDIYTLGNATWKVLSVNNAKEVKESEDNDTSIVIQLNYGDNKFLFMGDATSKVEKQLLNDNKLEKVDVLKVGHHGSNSSSSKKFLEKIFPKYSIISVSNSEYSKHPSQNTIERLNSINSKIYRTDKNGTIWITSDGSTIEIKELDININGANREAKLLEDRKYSLIFLL